MHAQFSGVMTALVTPFKDGNLDESSLRKLINWQIKSGVQAIVPCGTTGEAATLSEEEHYKIIKICVEEASGRVPVIAGAGSNSTEKAIKLAKQAKEAGADAHLQVTPYYNKPTQEGLFQHYQAIARVVDLPMILYNVPGRTAVNMLPETVKRLSQIDNIVGVKEASGNLEQIKEIIESTPDDFMLFSGEDAQNVEIYRLGGMGAISVVSNIIPEKVSAIWNASSKGDVKEAELLHEAIQPINKILFIETNPIPVKTALAQMGKIHEEFRLPLTSIAEINRSKLFETLKI
ncbi:MAG: 4-hydroxy-tetrahydrodipicolinate synthase [Pseudomonadota bacterium]